MAKFIVPLGLFDTVQHAPVLGRNFVIDSSSFCVFVPFSEPLVELLLLLFSLGFICIV